jgi:limonene-1,2-epoxide hydrolase
MAVELDRTIRAFFDAWVQRDPERLTSFFAPGGAWSEANREPAQGHDAIRAVFELQTGFASDFSFEFKKLAAVGDTVFTERTDRFVINDTPMVVHVAGIFEFDADGRIAAWRDYYDWQSLETQLAAAGVDLSGVHGA